MRFLLLAIVALMGVSCTTQRALLTATQGEPADLVDSVAYRHVIRPDDKISLSVWNHNDLSVGSVYNIYNSNEAFGKWILVDHNGTVDFPRIGQVAVAGKSCQQAADTLRTLYGAHITNPVVVVKVLNRSVEVFGEVKTPGEFLLEKEETTLAELIGKAEGWTDYANLKKVRLIRDDVSYTLNLKKLDGLAAHRITLRADDLIVVPPRASKGLQQGAPVIIPFASAATAIALFISLSNSGS